MPSAEPAANYRLIGPSEVGRVEDLLAGKPEKESRQRLHALIAEWLRMEMRHKMWPIVSDKMGYRRLGNVIPGFAARDIP
jgi:hypothetical protein